MKKKIDKIYVCKYIDNSTLCVFTPSEVNDMIKSAEEDEQEQEMPVTILGAVLIDTFAEKKKAFLLSYEVDKKTYYDVSTKSTTEEVKEYIASRKRFDNCIIGISEITDLIKEYLD